MGYVLRLSTEDWQVHAFPAKWDKQQEWLAVCGLRCPVDTLEEVFDRTPTHDVCLLRFGNKLDLKVTALRRAGQIVGDI
uniref:hypothetical protein n=1 Tax=Saccharothrix mutabilis TaxID=33921 RepID=UPI0031DBDF7D